VTVSPALQFGFAFEQFAADMVMAMFELEGAVWQLPVVLLVTVIGSSTRAFPVDAEIDKTAG